MRKKREYREKNVQGGNKIVTKFEKRKRKAGQQNKISRKKREKRMLHKKFPERKKEREKNEKN